MLQLLKPKQYLIIASLYKYGALKPRKLLTLCDIGNDTVFNNLTLLNKIGLVGFKRLNMRDKEVYLTPKGKLVAENLLEIQDLLTVKPKK